MGNIPLVALDTRTQQPSSLQEFSSLQQIMGARQDQQIRDVQLQQAQQSQADQKATTQAMQQWDGQDYTKIPSLILKNGGSANAVFAATQHIQDVRHKASEIAKNDAATNASNLESAIKTNDQYRGRLQAIINAPADQKQTLWQQEIAAEKAAGTKLPPNITDQYPGDDQVAGYGQSFRAWKCAGQRSNRKNERDRFIPARYDRSRRVCREKSKIRTVRSIRRAMRPSLWGALPEQRKSRKVKRRKPDAWRAHKKRLASHINSNLSKSARRSSSLSRPIKTPRTKLRERFSNLTKRK